MSIYSGFPTRKDETLYNRLLEKLIETLQNQLLQIVKMQGLTLTKSHLYEKIIRKMRQFEEHKYLEPKFSEILLPLATYIGMPEKLDIIPQNTQTRYQTPKQKLKNQSSYSHSAFSSKKESNGFCLNEAQHKKNELKNHIFRTKVRIERAGNKKQLSNSRKQYKKGHHQSFYASNQKRFSKMNALFNRKNKERTSGDKSEEQHRPNYRSVTESQSSEFHNKTRQYCIDLKVLREAEEELKKPKHAYQITSGDLTFHR